MLALTTQTYGGGSPGLRPGVSPQAPPGTQVPGQGGGTVPPPTAPRPGPPGAAPTGMQWAGGGQWRPWHLVPTAATPTPSPVPAPGAPGRAPTPGPGPSGAGPQPFVPQAPGQPPPQFGGGGQGMQPPTGPGPGATPTPGAFNDPYSALLASVPLMQQQMTRNISDAEAQAGFTGNRFGTYGANAAAQAGANTSMQMNEQLLQAMLNQGQNDQRNALSASALGLQGENLANQEQINQLMYPFQIGQAEQGRQDQFSNTAFNDWSQNRLGWLPLASQLAMSQHPSSYTPGSIYTTQEAGSPGFLQYATGIAGLLGAFGL